MIIENSLLFLNWIYESTIIISWFLSLPQPKPAVYFLGFDNLTLVFIQYFIYKVDIVTMERQQRERPVRKWYYGQIPALWFWHSCLISVSSSVKWSNNISQGPAQCFTHNRYSVTNQCYPFLPPSPQVKKSLENTWLDYLLTLISTWP